MQKRRNLQATLWIVSEVYYPEETSTGHYLTMIAEGLAKERPVSVICGRPNYSKRGIESPRREIRNDVTIRRCRSLSLDKNRTTYRVLNLISVSLAVFAVMVRHVRCGDLVLVGTNPPTLPFVAAFVCLAKRADCVLKAEDIYPDNMVAAGMIKRDGLLACAMNRAQRLLLRRMTAICVLGRDMAALVRNRTAPQEVRIQFVPNWADSDSIRPEPRSTNRMIREMGLSDKFIIGYAGNIGPLQGIDFLFDCVMHLRKHSEVHFVFIGTGKNYAWLEQSINNAGLSNVTLVGQRPRSDQSNFLNACDLALISLITGMTGVGVPSRTYNYLAAGKPLLAAVDADSEVATLIKEEAIGWVVQPGRVDAFVNTIMAAKSDLKRLEQMGHRSRELAASKYSFKNVLAQYSAFLRSPDTYS
jgi:colanic acid biosynthesis glycosyl transferase WcaI